MAEPVHLAQPFVIGAKGAAVVPQDSPEDKAACVYRIAVCPEGFREDDPSFGIPELAFQTVPLDLTAAEDAIERLEPRAELQTSEQAEAMNQAIRIVTMEVL
jgi:hypothetical protein